MMHQTRPSSAFEEIDRPARLGLRLTPHSTIALTSPPWITSVVDRMEYLFTLPEDWDGEGGLPLDFETAMDALDFLLTRAYHETPAPQIVPTGSGGIQIEWHMAGSDLEVSFEPGEPPAYFYVDLDGREREGSAVNEEGLVGELIRGLPVRD